MKKNITRFAPSPTGNLSVANLKIALLSWIHSKKYKGNFIVRIDDTNLKKCKIYFIKKINNILKINKIKALKYIFQTNKIYRYNEIIQFLKKKNFIYINYDNEKLFKFLKILKKLNFNFILKKNFLKKKNINYTIYIYKLIKIKNKLKKNFLIVKTNGIPVYNYSSIIDDYEININNIIRGIDHYDNLFIQINLLKILKKKLIKIIHVPMLLDINGKKLSKRNSKNKVIYFYKKLFFKETILNYLFNKKTKTSKFKIISIKKYIKIINFKKIKKSYFKFEKYNLIWFNKKILEKKSINYLNLILKKNIIKKNKKKFFLKNIKKILNLYKKTEINKIKIKYYKIFNNNFIEIKKINKEMKKNIFIVLIKFKKFLNKLYLLNLIKKFKIKKKIIHLIIKLFILEKIEIKNYLLIIKKFKFLIKNKLKISIKIFKIYKKSLSSRG